MKVMLESGRGRLTAASSVLAIISLVLTVGAGACRRAPASAPAPVAQNPSPMVERTRQHERIDTIAPRGEQFQITSLLSRPIAVFVPANAESSEAVLVIHFNGAPYVAMRAAAAQSQPVALAVVHLGAGSGVYERAFAETGMLSRIRTAVADSLATRLGGAWPLRRVYLSGFSAGYGAIRAILGHADTSVQVEGVLLLDGLHVSYIPERSPVASGGALDTVRLAPFIEYARKAAADPSTGRMVITHSEIFPGTFASTTETADNVLDALGIRRKPVLEWGPGGMQLLSTARRGRFLLLGFAGNTAPDHVDHYHGMPAFLERLLRSDEVNDAGSR